MARREGSFTFTFSKRNFDIRQLIEHKAENEPGFVKTDYFCEAVRFYEKNKNKENSLNEDYIKNLIAIMLQNNLNVNNEIKPEVNQVKLNSNIDMNEVDDNWLDED